jgi:AraC-like DNA-binding protein
MDHHDIIPVGPIQRQPIPALRPFVSRVWASDDVVTGRYAKPAREHVLPTGQMHLVFRLTDDPLRIFTSPDDVQSQSLGGAVVGGVRSQFYVRELTAPSCSVGVVLRPGAAAILLGATHDALAGRHTPLEDLWGSAARSVRERLLDAKNAADRLSILESVLESGLAVRQPRARGLHPVVASLIHKIAGFPSVAVAVRQSGVSHRQFIARFREAVGMGPKAYVRVLRFQRALQALRQNPTSTLAGLAADRGYSDQAHFNRDFLAFSGVTPLAYLRSSPREGNHLPMDGPGGWATRRAVVTSNFFNTSARGLRYNPRVSSTLTPGRMA